MKGIIVTPRFILKCRSCGKEVEVEIESEEDIPTEFIPWIYEGRTVVKEGSTVKAICPECSPVDYQKDWMEV